jgi:hypothetical protein
MSLSFDAVRRTPFVRLRLEVDGPQRSKPSSWEALGKAIEDPLRQLAEDLRSREPSVLAKCGEARGGVIERFVFLSLSVPTRPNSEAVVVGVTIERSDVGFRVTADICGDESGRIYAQEPTLELAHPTTSLIADAGALAARICRDPDLVLEAIRSSPEV